MLPVLESNYMTNLVLFQLAHYIFNIFQDQLVSVSQLYLNQHYSLPIYIFQQDQQNLILKPLSTVQLYPQYFFTALPFP